MTDKHTLHLTKEQLAALRAFATKNGRTWKSRLRMIWETGRYTDYTGDTGYLQSVRNGFGPTWLTKFSFDKPKTHTIVW